MNALTIPDGYLQNANGDLVKLENIKEIDLQRDELVTNIALRALEHSGVLAEFKASVFQDVRAFCEASAAKYKAKLGGAKGNVTLLSFNGRFKVQIANQDNISFDERLQAAKALLDKCIKKWSEGASDNLLALVNDAFQVDRTGNVSIRRVLGLRNLDIQDKDWRKAMDAISDSVQVVGSKAYIRIYERIGESGDYRPISLDVANV